MTLKGKEKRAQNQRQEPGENKPGRSILVVRFSSIGDVLLVTPVLRAIRQRWPGAWVSFLTREEFAPLIENNPHLDEVLTLARGGSLGALIRLTDSLRARRWNLLADLHRNFRSRIVRLRVPAENTAVYSKLLLRRLPLIYCRLNFYGPEVPSVPERYARPLSSLGVKLDSAPCEIFLTDQDRREVEALVSAAWPGLSECRFLTVAPGAAWPVKRWPAERFATAAGVLAGRLGLKVLVLGSARDNEECGAVACMLGEKSCLNLAGKLDIRASAAAVERSCCLITNDTGLMHIATATGTPVAAVFGPTTRHLGYFPYRADKKSVVIEEKLYCRPCTHNGRKRCPLRHFRCMLDIEPERVSEAVIGLLGKN